MPNFIKLNKNYFQKLFKLTIFSEIFNNSFKIFLSKIHNHFITTDKVSNYVIPKVQLAHCFISISLNDLKILGFPIRIDNKSYVRNAFYFNLCFVFDNGTRTMCYESIIKKCTDYLVSFRVFWLIKIENWIFCLFLTDFLNINRNFVKKIIKLIKFLFKKSKISKILTFLNKTSLFVLSSP